MRLTFVLLTAVFLQVSATSISQTVTISLKNAPIEKVFLEIERQTGIGFLYTKKMLLEAGKVSIDVKDKPVTDVLKQCFNGQSLEFTIQNNTIVITQKSGNVAAGKDALDVRIQITGKVADNEGNPLSGVSVVVIGTVQGTSTNSKGEFLLTNVDEDARIKFSFVGYIGQTISVKGRSAINVSLEIDVKQQSEIVVIGYGTTTKKDLTGSVSVISSKDIQDVPFTTVDNALAGKAAGVQVTKSDGTPGGAVRIRVRGSTSLLGGNDPLYVIDGVPVQVQSNFIKPGFDVSSPSGITVGSARSAGMSTAFVNGLNSLGGLNIDDIESITILKDASSTAIYGSKGANGVVIITTKKGKKDMRPSIMFSYYNTYTKAINQTVLNATQYKMLLSEAAKNAFDYRTAAGLSISPELNAIVQTPGTYFGKANTDWLDLVTRNTFSNNAELSVQGGGSASRYYTSISYNSTPGVVIGTDFQRVSGKLNIENEIGNHFKFITNINLGYTNQNITNGLYEQALRARPDYAPYDSTGNFTSFKPVGLSSSGFQNPLALATAINNAKTLTLRGSITGLYDFNSNLQFKTTVSLNMQNYNQRNFTPSYLDIGSFYGNVANNGGIGGNSNSGLNNWFFENTLTYNKTFKEKHAVTVLLGTSYETRKTSYFSATASGYPNDNVLNNLSSAATLLRTTGDNPSKPQSYLLSYYARANYSLLEKYLFTFTGRADGSSKFGPNNKFGYFPSGAVAWRISKENFLKNVSWIDDIKIRGSYGLTGTQNIGDQMYRTLYSPFSYAGANALVPTQLGNSGIKWETTKEFDAGLDLSFFGNRLQGTLDYYEKYTNGALLSLPVAPSSSYSSLLNNIVNLKNTGYELSLQGDIIRTKKFRWKASMNVTWAKSLVTKLSSSANLGQIGNLTGLESGNTAIIEGLPLGLIFGSKITGIIKTDQQLQDYRAQLGGYSASFPSSLGSPMRLLLDSSDGVGRYPNLFSQIIGNAAPKYYGGFTQEFSYKNFDLALYFTFSQGGQLMWGDYASSIAFSGTSNANAIMLNRWTPENPNSNQPRLIYDQNNLSRTNLSVFNSSYVKLRTLTLNYHFDKSDWMRKAGVSNASVFASATNLFTITKYPGNNPETSNDPYSVGGGYFDVSNFPQVKTYSLGIKVGF